MLPEELRCREPSSTGRAVRVLLLVGALAVSVSSCRPADRLLANCDRAVRLQSAALSISSQEDIDSAFSSAHLRRPQNVKTVSDAQIYLLRESVRAGCEDKTHAGYLLGTLFLREGRYQEAQTALDESVDACPTLDGYENLAIAYERLGMPRKAKTALAKAQALRNEAGK